VRRPWSALVALALLALAPKCVLCLAAYAGLATALGLGGRELCGAEPGTHTPALIVSALLVAAGIVCLIARKTTAR
jgi:hypothetical protein